MAPIRNNRINEWFRHVFQNRNMEVAGLEVDNKIVPVVDVSQPVTRAISASLSNATTGIVYTAPATGDTYLTFAALAAVRDATATTTGIVLEVQTQSGENCNILSIPGLTLTAHPPVTTAATFIRPIQIRKGGTVRILATTAVANFFARASINVIECAEQT